MSKSQKVKTGTVKTSKRKTTGRTIKITEQFSERRMLNGKWRKEKGGFLVTYQDFCKDRVLDRARCASLRSVKATVTQFRNKYGEPDAFDVDQELWEKLNLSLLRNVELAEG